MDYFQRYIIKCYLIIQKKINVCLDTHADTHVHANIMFVCILILSRSIFSLMSIFSLIPDLCFPPMFIFQ